MGRAVTGYGRMWIAAAGAACAVALAGCNGAEAGPTPSESAASSTTSTTTTPTGSTTTSSSPTGTATVTIPAAARERTPEGAKAFAAFYTEEMDRATVTADSSKLRVLAEPGCSACMSIIELVDGYKKRGERQSRSSLRLQAVEVTSETDKATVVDVLADDLPHEIVRADGSVVSTSPAAKINFRHTLAWAEIGWRVSDSEIVQ